jgi:hypothetical protein
MSFRKFGISVVTGLTLLTGVVAGAGSASAHYWGGGWYHGGRHHHEFCREWYDRYGNYHRYCE